MAVIEGGTSALIADVGVAAAQPLHVTVKPVPYGSFGHYAVSGATGTIAAGAAANSEIWQFRWTDATRLAIIYEVTLTGMYQLTGFTAGAGSFEARIARSFTAAGTGGTVLSLGGNNQKLRTSMGTSLVGEIRIATTAALGAGTKTLDSQAIGQYSKFVPAAANSQVFEPITVFSRDPGGEHPIVLAQNEGLVIRATVPATGTWVTGITAKWAETTAY